jgi:hypothetical protein
MKKKTTQVWGGATVSPPYMRNQHGFERFKILEKEQNRHRLKRTKESKKKRSGSGGVYAV